MTYLCIYLFDAVCSGGKTAINNHKFLNNE